MDKRMFMTGLPRNFYDDAWYKNLDDAEEEPGQCTESRGEYPIIGGVLCHRWERSSSQVNL